MKSFKTPKGTQLPLKNIKGKDYLQVAHRLVWFREEKALWSIETSFIELSDKHAVARAVIKNEQGVVMSSAHKFEDKAGYNDYREKAETGAIGRALAMIGYGTQFCGYELDEGTRLADAPHALRPLENRTVYQTEPDATPIPLNVERPYRITFGKYRQRSIEEVPAADLRSYREYLLKKAAEKGLKEADLSEAVRDFLGRVRRYLGE